MKIVIDMNLSPQWVEVLMLEGHESSKNLLYDRKPQPKRLCRYQIDK